MSELVGRPRIDNVQERSFQVGHVAINRVRTDHDFKCGCVPTPLVFLGLLLAKVLTASSIYNPSGAKNQLKIQVGNFSS
jgi:hypothetical protein